MDQQNPNLPLAQDPNFLRYLQGFLAKPINAGLIQMRRISNLIPTDGQVLAWSKSNNSWGPKTIASSTTTGTINLAKLTPGGTNGSITVTNGLITSFTNPT